MTTSWITTRAFECDAEDYLTSIWHVFLLTLPLTACIFTYTPSDRVFKSNDNTNLQAHKS